VAALALSLGLWNTFQNSALLQDVSTYARTALKIAVAEAFIRDDSLSATEEYLCTHQYNIEIVSNDPLMIYINQFLSPYEVKYLYNMA